MKGFLMDNLCIHDNIINSYIVDLENQIISFKTLSETAESIDMVFINVLAHRFKNVIR